MKHALKSSDPDNEYPKKLNESYFELAIFSLFKIDLMDLIKMKASLSKMFHIQPTEIDKMPMWEYELYLLQLNELIKEENEHQKKEMDKNHVHEYMEMARPNNMKKMMNPTTPNYKPTGLPKLK